MSDSKAAHRHHHHDGRPPRPSPPGRRGPSSPSPSPSSPPLSSTSTGSRTADPGRASMAIVARGPRHIQRPPSAYSELSDGCEEYTVGGDGAAGRGRGGRRRGKRRGHRRTDGDGLLLAVAVFVVSLMLCLRSSRG